jgi:hypothetical protein
MGGENRRSAEPEPGSDPVADRLRVADISSSWFDRHFAHWYWSLMLPDE